VSFRRIIWVVLDSVGIGEMPDAEAYGDKGSDTLGNMARELVARGKPLKLPNLCRLGLANIKALAGLAPDASPIGSYGKAALASPGKDTTTGHWEMAGIHLEKPFPLFPHGFPPEVMNEFERRIGRSSLGNKPASGTEIIKELGEKHVRTGSPIVYTSADSVFQVAAHEEVIPLFELYKMCEIAREILRGPYEVGRVIARPFIGEPGHFTRTPNRHDYAVPPPKGMLLDKLAERRVEVFAVGKISDVYLGRGISDSETTKSNADGMSRILKAMDEVDAGLIFANLVDFDMLYGHRKDVEGFARSLEEFDALLGPFLAKLVKSDLLMMTADHGCDPDPVAPTTDHSREYVPIVCCSPGGRGDVKLGVRHTLADMGQTVAQNFGGEIPHGASFLTLLY
jgi:phosphopentomutase